MGQERGAIRPGAVHVEAKGERARRRRAQLVEQPPLRARMREHRDAHGVAVLDVAGARIKGRRGRAEHAITLGGRDGEEVGLHPHAPRADASQHGGGNLEVVHRERERPCALACAPERRQQLGCLCRHEDIRRRPAVGANECGGRLRGCRRVQQRRKRHVGLAKEAGDAGGGGAGQVEVEQGRRWTGGGGAGGSRRVGEHREELLKGAAVRTEGDAIVKAELNLRAAAYRLRRRRERGQPACSA